MRIGVAHHYGWAVVVTAGDDHQVVDRRRIELIEPGLPVAPVHHEGGPWEDHRTGPPLTDDELRSLVADVRASVVRATVASLDGLATSLSGPVESLSLRAWDVLPTDIAAWRVAPWESRADSVMYLEVLAEVAAERGWAVHRYEKDVEAAARAVLGDRAADVLDGPRQRLGPPWAKDHRTALAATIVAHP